MKTIMKEGYTICILLLLGVQQGSGTPIQARDAPPCAVGDEFFSPGPECFEFYFCRDGSVSLLTCPPPMVFNVVISRCDAEENVVCSGPELPGTDAPAPSPSPTTPEATLGPTPENVPPCAPGDEFLSAGPECSNFYLCHDGSISLLECPPPMLWNDFDSRCDDEENVVCSVPELPGTDAPAPSPSPTTPEATLSPTGEPLPSTLLPEAEGALPILYPGYDCPPNIEAFQVHVPECRRFYYCLYGIRYPQTCPFLQTFNYIKGYCVNEEDKECFPGSA